MAYDNVQDDYHLTPHGWDSSNDRPADAVETWTLSIYQRSAWSDEQRSWTRTWVDPNADTADVAELHRKFPPPVNTEPSPPMRRRSRIW